jgi:hypothetical protein
VLMNDGKCPPAKATPQAPVSEQIAGAAPFEDPNLHPSPLEFIRERTSSLQKPGVELILFWVKPAAQAADDAGDAGALGLRCTEEV